MKKVALGLVALAITSASFGDAEFQIKGLQLGKSQAQSCAGAEVTTELDSIIDSSSRIIQGLTKIGASECKVKADTFGGLKVEDDVLALFLEGKLIQVKLDTAPVVWTEYAVIFQPLTDLYGKPKIEKDSGFTTHIWKQGAKTLSVSRFDQKSGIESLEIVLRDEVGFKEYEKRVEKNTIIFNEAGSDARRSDIFN